MKKSAAALAAIAVLVLGLLSGIAVAGNPHGAPPGQAKQESTPSTDSSAGVKPSNNTQKDQTCTTGGGQGSSATCSSSTYPGKSDSSKRYGNGKTAAQIANGKGAPAGTPVYGPGNSQPHKICGRDVHAYGKGHSSKCGTKPASTTTTTAVTTTEASAPTTTTATVATTTTEATTTTTAAAATTTTAAAAALGTSSPTPPPAQSANSGVLGATKALSAPATTPSHAPAGVLGTLKTLGTGTLPFTGLRLWIFELIALGLIGAGVATRLIARRRLN